MRAQKSANWRAGQISVSFRSPNIFGRIFCVMILRLGNSYCGFSFSTILRVRTKLGRSSFEVETKFVRSWAEVHTKWDSKFVEVGPRIVRKLTVSHQEGKGSCFSLSGQSAIYRELWLHLASTNGRGLFLMLSGHPRSSFTALPKIVETLHFQVRNSLD